MADRPTTSIVGRTRARSAHQTPKSTAIVGRTRSRAVQKPKTKGSGKKTAMPTKRAVRPILQLEWDVVEANQRPFGDQLPNLPPLDLEQGDNLQIYQWKKKTNRIRKRNQIKFQINPLNKRNLINQISLINQICPLTNQTSLFNQISPLTYLRIYPHKWHSHIN